MGWRMKLYAHFPGTVAKIFQLSTSSNSFPVSMVTVAADRKKEASWGIGIAAALARQSLIKFPVPSLNTNNK
jgi:hypothetical protein